MRGKTALQVSVVAVLAYGHASAERANEVLLDFWDNAPRIAIATISPTPDLAAERTKRQAVSFANSEVVLRYDRAKVGSFSLEPAGDSLTLLTNLWSRTEALGAGALLDFWLCPRDSKKISPELPAPIELMAADGARQAVSALRVEESDGWIRYRATIPAGTYEAVALRLPSARTLVDGVVFHLGSQTAGLTDKPLAQWYGEAAETRRQRLQSAMEHGVERDVTGELPRWFDQMWLGQDLPACNASLRGFFSEELRKVKDGEADLWSLALNVRLFQFYYTFGSKSGRSFHRLEPETEKILLELLWARTEKENDIGWASTNSWWLTGSENHDLNAKVSCLISSRIFMNEPAYRDRVYPNAAHGPGYGYWFHNMFKLGDAYGPVTKAAWKPAGPRTPAEHYRAWVTFFDTYLTERARHGFFLERAAPGYMKWTLSYLQTLRAFCGDEALRQKTGSFLDLIWADWAQEQIGGVRGGPKTRHQHTVGGYDSMTDISRFLLGGPGRTNQIYTAMLLDDYELPPVIFDLALDTKGRGSYAIVSRGVGEEEPIRPRPAGTERTLLINPASRYLKYSWVTPDYILGTQMDHPDAIHSHLGAAGRWHGLIVAGAPEARILPTGGFVPALEGKKSEPDMSVMYQTVQDRNVLILQQNRRWSQISPDWFPSVPMYEKPIFLYLGKGWDEKKEANGWVFLRKGNAYAAVRELRPKLAAEKVAGRLPDAAREDDSNLVALDTSPVQWNKEATGFELRDKFSPVVLHAGNAAEHGSFDSFQQTVGSSKIDLHKTVVPGYHTLDYQGGEKGSALIHFFANTPEIPLIGGKALDYQPAALFSGPFVNSVHGSGKFELRKGGLTEYRDFTTPRPEFVIYLLGDSTMADKPQYPAQPERGWGQYLRGYFQPGVLVSNQAVNGRSTKSFIDEGRWQKIQNQLRPGDHVIIQFGHNDEKAKDPTRYTEPHTTYKENLLRFVHETRAQGATPILATPICRRHFNAEGQLEDTHGDYPAVVREVARQENVPLLDLQKDTDALLRNAGPEPAKKYFLWIEPGQYASLPQGRRDDTHLSEAGARAVCDFAVQHMRNSLPPLTAVLNPN